MSLTTLSAIKRHLGISANLLDEDAKLEQFRLAAEETVYNYLNRRSLETTTYTELYAGNGYQKLVLRNRPIQSITSVYEDDNAVYGEGATDFPSTTLLTAGIDYVLQRDGLAPEAGKSGMVIRLGKPWGTLIGQAYGLLTTESIPGIGNIKITYIAGYVNIPYDVALAVHQIVAEIRQTAPTGGIMESEKLDYYSYARGRTDMTLFGMTGAKKLLAPYVEVSV